MDHPRLTPQQQAVWIMLNVKIQRANWQTDWLRRTFQVQAIIQLTPDQCAEALRRLERMR